MSKESRVQITGGLLARNTLLNFIGQAVPLVVGVVTIPFIVRELGTERFGLLSLAWVILGYFAIFDLGLGRATTKFVAEALGKGEEDEVPRFVWTAVTVQAILGILGALILISITPLLAERILNIPPELVGETKATFYILALSVPVVLVSASFRGVLEAAQRFDLVNAVKIPISSLTFLLPLMGLLLGLRLPGIVALILLARLGALATFIAVNLRMRPQLKRYAGSFSIFPRLFTFGGWVTVSSIVNPILIYFDRFLIGSLSSMVALGYYTAPFEMVIRLWIIPASLVMSLFPALSTLAGVEARQRVETLFLYSIKYIFTILGLIVLVLVLFAREIIQIWLGEEFALHSAMVLQILTFGVLIHSLAHVPFALLHAIRRPDVPAKFHLIEAPIYLGILRVLINQWGIVGASIGWTLRMMLHSLLLFGAAFKLYGLSPRLLFSNGLKVVYFTLIILAITAYGVKTLSGFFPLSAQVTFWGAFFGLVVWIGWRRILDAEDRSIILETLGFRRIGTNQEAKEEIQDQQYEIPYHWMLTKNSKALYDLRNQMALEMIGSLEGKKCLVVGCGDGREAADLITNGAAEVIGIDISKKALQFARCLVPKAHFYRMDAAHMGFQGECFDVVVCLDVLEHIPDNKVGRVVIEMSRVLKPKGLLIVSVPSVNKKLEDKHYRHYHPDELENILRPYFTSISVSGYGLHIPLTMRFLNYPVIWKILNKLIVKKCAPNRAIYLIVRAQKA